MDAHIDDDELLEPENGWLEDVLESVMGHPPRLDDDGDYVIRIPGGIVYVREVADDNMVLLHSPVVFNAVDTAKVGYAVHLLNQAHPDLKFTCVGSMVTASARLYANFPVPQHVVRVLVAFSELLADGEDIAENLSGDFAWSEDSDTEAEETTDESLPEPVQILIQLDSEGKGILSPEEVATICENDRHAVLRYLTVVSEQKIEWSKSADAAIAAGDADEAAACEHEAAAWQATHDSLRDALRFIVLDS